MWGQFIEFKGNKGLSSNKTNFGNWVNQRNSLGEYGQTCKNIKSE